MCTFLAINTASIQLIPTTAIGILAVAGAKNATAIVPTAIIATTIAAISGVVAAKVLQTLPIFRAPTVGSAAEKAPAEGGIDDPAAPAVTALTPLAILALGLYAAAILTIFVRLIAASGLPEKGIFVGVLSAVSVLAVPVLLSFFPLYGACRGVKVYEQFVEGAKEAFGTAQRVIPYLVAMLLSISLLRTSGVIEFVTARLHHTMEVIHFPADLLPLVLMRPLSGSGTQGIFVELVQHFGPDSFTTRVAATIYGSTETTFYVLAVYFGSVAIRRTRHAVVVGLIADTVAVIASVAICRLLFAGS